jgi:hypothetical protein
MAGRRQRTVFKRLGAAQQWILGAGALASALVAIIALVNALTPEESTKAAGEVHVDDMEPEDLKAYVSRSRQDTRADRTAFAVAQLAQDGSPSGEPTPQQESPGGEGEQPSAPGTTGPGPSTTAPSQGETPQEGTTAKPLRGLEDQPPGVQELLDPEQTKGPIIQAVDLPESKSRSGERRTEAKAKKALTGEPHASDREIRRTLAGTRLRRLAAPHASTGYPEPRLLPAATVTPLPLEKRDLLVPRGQSVDFSFRVTGFKGRELEVRWSLFDAKSGRRVPPPWLNNRRAVRLTADRADDSASGAFWVPLPKAFRGPFRVKVELFGPNGARLDTDKSPTFG